jgi:hypothetical protein
MAATMDTGTATASNNQLVQKTSRAPSVAD